MKYLYQKTIYIKCLKKWKFSINCSGKIIFDFICFFAHTISFFEREIIYNKKENYCQKNNYSISDLRIFNKPALLPMIEQYLNDNILTRLKLSHYLSILKIRFIILFFFYFNLINFFFFF